VIYDSNKVFGSWKVNCRRCLVILIVHTFEYRREVVSAARWGHRPKAIPSIGSSTESISVSSFIAKFYQYCSVLQVLHDFILLKVDWKWFSPLDGVANLTSHSLHYSVSGYNFHTQLMNLLFHYTVCCACSSANTVYLAVN
jgi:hypothetical protein